MSGESETITFLIEFDRIGARHEVAPLLATVAAGRPDLIANRLEYEILCYARPKLGSRLVEVMLDAAGAEPFQAPPVSALDGCTGTVSAGGRSAGPFHVRIDRPGDAPHLHRALPKRPRESVRYSACGLAVSPEQATEKTDLLTCPECIERAGSAPATGSER